MTQENLEGIERAPREEIESFQLVRLRRLLAEVGEKNAFYGPRIREAGLGESLSSLQEFRERMPFTTKEEFALDQRENAPFGTNLTAPVEDYVRYHQTSSTTGAPLRWLDTERGWQWMMDGWEAVYRAAGVGPRDRILFAFSFGPFIGFWVAFCAAQRMGALVLPGGAADSAMRLRSILTNRATVLVCTPTYAARLGEVAREEGLELADGCVRAILVGGEPGASVPAVRERIETLWPGARVHDHHGMTEVGPVSVQCPAHRDVLHVLESAYHAEIVDPDTGGPLHDESDDLGELVLTTLGREDSPAIRYRTGDLVSAQAGPCECGRTSLRLHGGILAGADDMIVVRGVNLYPASVEQVVRGFADVEEYRVEVDSERSMTEVRLTIEPTRKATDPEGLCRALERALYRAYNLRIPVSAAKQGELPRFELKARRWIRKGTA